MKKYKYFQALIGSLLLLISIAACNGDGRTGLSDARKKDDNKPLQGKAGVARANSDAQVQIGLSSYVHIFQTINMALRADDYQRSNHPGACWEISAEPPVDPDAKRIVVEIDWRNCRIAGTPLRGREKITVYLGDYTQDDYFDRHKFYSLEVESVSPLVLAADIRALRQSEKSLVTLDNYRFELRNRRGEENHWNLTYSADFVIENEILRGNNGQVARRFEVENRGILNISNGDDLDAGAVIPVRLIRDGNESLVVRYSKVRSGSDRNNGSEEQILALSIMEADESLNFTDCGVPVGSLIGAFSFDNENTTANIFTNAEEMSNSLAQNPKLPWSFNCERPMEFMNMHVKAISNLKEHSGFRSTRRPPRRNDDDKENNKKDPLENAKTKPLVQ